MVVIKISLLLMTLNTFNIALIARQKVTYPAEFLLTNGFGVVATNAEPHRF